MIEPQKAEWSDDAEAARLEKMYQDWNCFVDHVGEESPLFKSLDRWARAKNESEDEAFRSKTLELWGQAKKSVEARFGA